MKLRACITIEVEAADYIEAAVHQGRIQDLVLELQRTYSQASVDIKECRAPRRAVRRPASLSIDLLEREAPTRRYLD